VNSQVALTVCGEPESIMLLSAPYRVWALCNIKNKGYYLYTTIYE